MAKKLYIFRDVGTHRVAKIWASTPTLAVRRYEKRRKGRFLPNYEFLDKIP